MKKNNVVKKFAALSLSCAMALSLAACSGGTLERPTPPDLGTPLAPEMGMDIRSRWFASWTMRP